MDEYEVGKMDKRTDRQMERQAGVVYFNHLLGARATHSCLKYPTDREII